MTDDPTTDPWTAFLRSDTLGRLRVVADPVGREAVRPWLGDDAVADYLTLAGAVDLDLHAHLAGDGPSVVFVPGVMGSLLASDLGGMWWIDARSRKHLDDLWLATDGVSDGHKAAGIRPVAVDCSYEGFLVAAANRDLAVRPVPYDWRKPLPASASRLRDAVVAEHDRNDGAPVHLVAHSMGGLLVRETLRQHPELWDVVGQVVFVATPHYGAPAITTYLHDHFGGFTLMRLLGRYITRRTFRTLGGVLDLLPAPLGVYPGTRELPAGSSGYPHPCANFDLYDAGAYRLAMSDAEKAGFQRVLDQAAGFHRTLAAWHLGLDQSLRERMAVIAGVGLRTVFATRFERGLTGERFRTEKDRRAGDPDREGDGRVPLRSAELEYVDTVRYCRGRHADLPNVPAVYEDVFRRIAGQEMLLPASAVAALGAHLGDDDAVVTPALTAAAPPATDDDPGYLDDDEPDDAALDELDRRLAAGELPEFARLRIL
jgi:pimeloyl-ACP methyl ester carboxylesterase